MFGPHPKLQFWGSNQTVLTWVRKNSIEPNVLVRHLAQEFHPNNMQSSVASRKTSEPKKMVTLSSLGPIQNYNFWWGSNLHSVDLSQKELYRAWLFWWGILRKSSIRTTCNLPLQVVKHLNQRRWWLYQVWAPSKITILGLKPNSVDLSQKELYRA